MSEIKPLWGAQELAARLGTTRRTINTLRWQIKMGLQCKDRLPLPLAIGGRPRWDPELVEAWLRDKYCTDQGTTAVAPRSKVGRKRKAVSPTVRLH